MFGQYIERSIEKVLEKTKKVYPVIMITGPRQVGKTTLLSMSNMDKNITYVTLDDMKLRGLAEEDPELFLKTYGTPIIIDEFQYAPNLLSYIKIIVDKKRLENLKENKSTVEETLFYLTGSQVFHTMKNISESLAGRVGILDLYGLTTRELNKKEERLFVPSIDELKKREKVEQYSVKDLYERILKGSFPELYKNKEMEVETYFSSYIRTYIERDIRELISVKDENKFMRFITSLAARTGAELNITDIANSVDITNPTAENWVSILENTGLIYLLKPYFNNDIKRAIKRPKIYFLDTGLASYLVGYTNAEILEKSAYSGAIFETYIISEIIKNYTNNGLDAKKYLFYFRDSNMKEIDLIMIYNNVLYPIEIKKTTNPSKKSIKNFDVVDKLVDKIGGMEKGTGTVICMTDDIFPIDSENYQVPIEII